MSILIRINKQRMRSKHNCAGTAAAAADGMDLFLNESANDQINVMHKWQVNSQYPMAVWRSDELRIVTPHRILNEKNFAARVRVYMRCILKRRWEWAKIDLLSHTFWSWKAFHYFELSFFFACAIVKKYLVSNLAANSELDGTHTRTQKKNNNSSVNQRISFASDFASTDEKSNSFQIDGFLFVLIVRGVCVIQEFGKEHKHFGPVHYYICLSRNATNIFFFRAVCIFRYGYCVCVDFYVEVFTIAEYVELHKSWKVCAMCAQWPKGSAKHRAFLICARWMMRSVKTKVRSIQHRHARIWFCRKIVRCSNDHYYAMEADSPKRKKRGEKKNEGNERKFIRFEGDEIIQFRFRFFFAGSNNLEVL